ncbi:MAG: methylmalonyl Co-A mutase-associated GTPase MeaB [Verrucomicrobiae bacterium]|nr:methylmalonyl Co-A mutase-associated GTPase MeaB [Verrucomicrobiae bacterium]
MRAHGAKASMGMGVDDYVAGVRRGDRAVLARAITLIESTSARHQGMARDVLEQLLPATGRSRRVGITGVPGVGKSTFIEALGLHLCGRGLKVAVLAIDPTSTLSRGSILGDRTRMERLSGEPNAFIRPSPAGGTLGGVARRTRETLLLCEAAGFEAVLVETVGVGQSEVTLRSMVDFFLLLLLPGAGDDLQGIKRGIMEMADAVLINKADGENRARAESARSEQAMALHHLAPATAGWAPEVGLCSGRTGEGIPEFWAMVEQFYGVFEGNGGIAARRREQSMQWLEETLSDALVTRFRRHPEVRSRRPDIERALAAGEIGVAEAAARLLEIFQQTPAGEPGGTFSGTGRQP